MAGSSHRVSKPGECGLGARARSAVRREARRARGRANRRGALIGVGLGGPAMGGAAYAALMPAPFHARCSDGEDGGHRARQAAGVRYGRGCRHVVRARAGWTLARHRGGDPEGPAPARRLEVWARARNRAPPFNSAMKLTTPGEGGASQLIARLNGKRSPACRLSACGCGAPPPDQRPRARTGPSLRPQRAHGRERARAGARRRAVASLRLRLGPSRGLPGAHGARRAPARGGGRRR